MHGETAAFVKRDGKPVPYIDLCENRVLSGGYGIRPYIFGIHRCGGIHFALLVYSTARIVYFKKIE